MMLQVKKELVDLEVLENKRKWLINLDKYLSPKDVGNILGMGKNKTYKFIMLNGFPKIKIGKRYYIPENELSKYLEKHVGTKIVVD